MAQVVECCTVLAQQVQDLELKKTGSGREAKTKKCFKEEEMDFNKCCC